MSMLSPQETLACDYMFDTIKEGIDCHGVAIVLGVLNPDIVDELNREFDSIQEHPDHSGLRNIALDHGKGRIVSRRCLQKKEWIATQNLFSDPLQKELAENYWRKPIELNSEIFVMNEVPGTAHVAQDLHFDVVETFKVFVYLNDITVDNGAFYCIPGSHRDVAARRRELGSRISYENRDLTRAPERTHEAIPIEGPAGTVIFFTTEVLHMAGKVVTGERRIMRGHTRPAREQGLSALLKRMIGK